MNRAAASWLGRSVASRPGVIGIDDPKWLAVAGCYLGAIVLMALDPWFGAETFAYTQGIFVVILALLIVSGVAWESCLLGRPRGVNLLLQCVLVAPVTLLIGRIMGPATQPDDPTLIEQVLRTNPFARAVLSYVPHWITDIVRSPFVLVLIFFICFAFTQRRPNRRVGLILVGFLIPLINAFAHPPPPDLRFVAGIVCLGVGVALQAFPYRSLVAQQHVLQRLQHLRDEHELSCSLRLARQAMEDGFITEEAAVAAVERTYAEALNQGADLRSLARGVTTRLVREHRVLELHGDERGFFLVPNPALYEIESLFDEISMVMRKSVLTLFAVVWLLSPIDIFPDFVPIIGVVDDALIALVGAGQWAEHLSRRRRTDKYRPLPPGM